MRAADQTWFTVQAREHAVAHQRRWRPSRGVWHQWQWPGEGGPGTRVQWSSSTDTQFSTVNCG